MNRPVIVIGAGGHARVVADALLAAGQTVLGFTDKDRALHGCHVCGIPVLGGDDILDRYSRDRISLANGLGSTTGSEHGLIRERAENGLAGAGWSFVSVRHPSAVISALATIGQSTHVLAASVVQAGARVSAGVIVNTAAVVEHDCEVGAWTHLAPGALLCGNVVLGENVYVGAGAIIRQGVRVETSTVIGAGAVVVGNCRGGVWTGVPARLRGNQP